MFVRICRNFFTLPATGVSVFFKVSDCFPPDAGFVSVSFNHPMKDRVFVFAAILSLSQVWGQTGGLRATNPPRTALVISVQDHFLSVKIHDVPLEEVLRELAQRTHLTVRFHGSVAKKNISVAFENLPLGEGVSRILRDMSYVLTYVEAGSPKGISGLSRLQAIRVLR